MNKTNGPSGFSSGNESDGQSSPRDRGARRRKLAGYLKAANELRQSYQETYGAKWAGRDRDTYGLHGQTIPGSFPDVAIVSNGAEEMMLFPSYARRHMKKPKKPEDDLTQEEQGLSDQEYWKKEFERNEDERALVDVDVRGWVYTPQRGPLTRKNRIMVGLARQLSGLPAPTDEHYAQADSHDKLQTTHEDRVEARRARAEAEDIAAEAEKLLSTGEREARQAERGAYSEDPPISATHPTHSGHSSIRSTPGGSPDRSSGTSTPKLGLSRIDSAASVSMARRSGWSPFAPSNPPPPMTPSELVAANTQMMNRLRPFMATPAANVPITIFFFNDETSQSRTVTTDDYGHFNLRAALEFMPTEIRILASDKLSATSEIALIEPKGISIISDVDDTLKHSAISAGAREIFRNIFVRDLSELTIEGVKDWYTKMYSLGARLHYVSNAPWQTYPLLKSYFELAGLPPGSFHLKKYTGMLQGIFEPVAERKKGTLERLMGDFPDRKFILVGDSGEADLEVYVEMVEQYPGQILGVFIRDVTSSTMDKAKGSSDPSSVTDKKESATSRSAQQDAAENRPSLPPRPSSSAHQSQDTEDLIDFSDQTPHPTPTNPTPAKPMRPSNLRKSVQSSDLSPRQPLSWEPKARPPPIPHKPRSLSSTTTASETQTLAAKTPLPLPPKPGYLSSASQKRPYPPNDATAAPPPPSSTTPRRTTSTPVERTLPPPQPQPQPSRSSAPPPPAPRRGLTSLPAAAANKLWYGTSTQAQPSSSPPSGSGDGAADDAVAAEGAEQLSKKEELWRRRWARAEGVLRREGVVLVSWRVGADAKERCVALAKRGLRELEEGR